MTHEYLLVIYGVLLWQCEQYFVQKGNLLEFIKTSALQNIGRSMIWGGIIVVFDDEIMSQYNSWAELDYEQPPIWFYVACGFCIDMVRSFITERYLK